jgi:hypothetical protein
VIGAETIAAEDALERATSRLPAGLLLRHIYVGRLGLKPAYFGAHSLWAF